MQLKTGNFSLVKYFLSKMQVPREFQSVHAAAIRNVFADVQEKCLTEIPRVRNTTDRIFISGNML